MLARLSFEKTSAIVARGLGLRPAELEASFEFAGEDALPDIIKMRRVIFGLDNPGKDERYLRWRYQFDDPEQNGLWVFKRRDELLGVIGLEFTRLHYRGDALPIARSMDIMARPDIDGFGLGVWMNLCILNRYPVVYVTGGNEKSQNLLQKIFFPMPPIATWGYITSSERFLSDRMPNHRRLARRLALFVNQFLRLRLFLSRPNIPRGVRFSKTEFFDARFDDLNQAAAESGAVFVSRDSAALKWRFLDNPRKYTIRTCSLGDTLLGYTVSRCSQDGAGGDKSGLIVDWLARALPDGHGSIGKIEGRGTQHGVEDVLSWIVHHTTREMLKEKCENIYAGILDPVSKKAFQKIGFVLRSWTSGFYFSARDPALHEQLIKSDRWFLTGFDSDTV